MLAAGYAGRLACNERSNVTPTRKRERLRAVLAGPTCVSPATVFDALSARLAQRAGFEIGILSGSVSGNTLLAAPDLMLQTLTEFAAQVRRITRASDLSLVLDSDTGYGNALNVMRTVQELEHAGTAGLMIEDVVMPQRFGASALETVSTEEMVGKLRAAVAAREDSSLVLIARTAALKTEDAQRTAARVRAYAATGVDAIFISGLASLDQFDAIRAATRLPIVVGSAPNVKRQELADRGVRLALQGHQPVAAVVKTLREVYAHLYSGAPPSGLKDRIASAEEMAAVMKAEQYDAWRRDFLL
jgi:carboxyvinyl-carboxyphosphonate phosphorylmutase